MHRHAFASLPRLVCDEPISSFRLSRSHEGTSVLVLRCRVVNKPGKLADHRYLNHLATRSAHGRRGDSSLVTDAHAHPTLFEMIGYYCSGAFPFFFFHIASFKK